MMQNSLILNRLLILTNEGKVAYDEQFHKGVNIIRGDNSSGKSTITHFIFYVLGGAFNSWVKEAQSCSCVMAEIEANGATLSLRRDLNFNVETGKANDKESMYIFYGGLDTIMTDPSAQWGKFGFNTTDNKLSFSNILFNNLGMPIVKGDNNITMHQMLRLIYVDQESPTASLFLYERFDSELTRETVAELLLGVYNEELYDCKQAKNVSEKELDEIKQEIRIIKRFAHDETSLTPSYIGNYISNQEEKIQDIETKIIELNAKTKQVRYSIKSKMAFEELNTKTLRQRDVINTLDSQIHLLRYDIEDSKFFIETLTSKLRAIKNSVYTRQLLIDFPIEYCPECLSDLEPVHNANSCKLCKQPISENGGVTQARKIQQELEFQLKESTQLLAKKESKLNTLKIEYSSEKILYQQLQTQVNSALQDVKSSREEAIDKLLTDKGFIEGEILQYRTLLEKAESYQILVSREKELRVTIENLSLRISHLIRSQESLMTEINKKIEKEGLFLLNNDLRRQTEFAEAKEFNIDYKNNIAYINDKGARYSASSNFYLKVAARYAIFLASLGINRMRYPRFIFCDNMEDKGIQPDRAQNFQRIIINEAAKYDTNSYQIIYTTSLIPEDLNNSAYCVGEYYTETNPTLKNV